MMQPPARVQGNLSDVGIISGLLVIALAPICGCSRAHYRQKADQQVYEILAEKNEDPRWQIPHFGIGPDPRSRFFDPADPDCPPLPPDDPTAHRYMEVVDGMTGSKRWARFGRSDYLENPEWTHYFPASGDPAGGSLPNIEQLALADAVELSLIHNREYQTQLENLYLAALNLTFDRYRFDVRPLGFLGEPSTALFYEHQPDGQSNVRLGPTTFGISKLFPTGAQFVAELANNTLWLFSGPDGTGAATTVAYSLVQPILRGAGREIVLEDLTQAERNVVYATRDFARFRKQFFVSTITGGQVAGLQRFLRGFEFLASSGDTPSVGFFPLLLRMQQLRNLETIVRTLEFLIEEMETGGAPPLDIARLESSLAYYRSDLIAETRHFQDRMDQYKVQLGLPPGMAVTLDDSLLESFQFVDPFMVDVENRLRIFGRAVRNLQLPADPRQIETLLVDLGRLSRSVQDAVALVQSDFHRFDAVAPERFAQLDEPGKRQLARLISQERELFDELLQIFGHSLGKLEALKQDASAGALEPDGQRAVVESIGQLRNELLVTVRRASGVQIIVRVELVATEPVEFAMDEAVRIARTDRLDLMNRRALVMDARRQLEVAADALEGNLDLVVAGELNTPPWEENDDPFAFRGRDSQFRVGLGFTTPLDRRAERNNYRATQIAYQRARRGYMLAEDQVELEVRQAVRTLDELSQRIIQLRRRVQYSARELDLAETQEQVSQRGLSLTSALRNINRSADELIEAWLDYETTRLNLFRDTGLMQIDPQGFWLDPFYREMAAGAAD